MTIRAIVLGLLGACFIAGVGFLNDSVALLRPMVGHNFPTSVFGLLFIVVMAGNPVLRWLHARWVFRPSELGVIVALMLAGCSIPGCGLMVYFPPAAVMPIQLNKVATGWQKYDVLSYVPSSMLVADGRDDSMVVDGFVRGWGKPGDPIGLGDVPWSEWFGPLTTWLPLIFLFALTVICLSLIVHRQWSKHESLRYPIADFATTLMGQGPGKGSRSIFRNRMFWLGLGVLLTIRVVNGLHAWYPNSVEIPMQFPLPGLMAKLPDVPAKWRLKIVNIYPTVIAFCFLVSSEVGLSLGISQIALMFVTAMLLKAGVDFSGSRWSGATSDWQRMGSYFGVALIVLYTGRYYYWGVFKGAFSFRRREEIAGYAVWACRILLLSLAALVVILSGLGLSWPLAIIAVLLIMMVFLVMARINAESGLFVISPNGTPLAIMIGLFGVSALGPQAIAVIGLLSLVFVVDSVEALMPFMVNGLKMCGKYKVAPGRVGWGATGAFALALVVAVPVALWANQNYGVTDYYYGSESAPKELFNTVEQAASKLTRSGELKTSNTLTPWQRITRMDPDSRFLWSAGIGVSLVVVFSVLRLRYTWWPIHPIIFVVWGTYSMGHVAYSFLLGWLIRQMVTRLGGVQKYREVRVLMFGVIAGELLGRLVFMIVGAIYYVATGQNPPKPGFYLS